MTTGSHSADEPLRGQLARLLRALEATGRAALPRSDLELLQSIAEAAARIFGAAAASIALVDEERQVLEFKVSYGAGSESVVGLCIPLDQGLAGYVAMTGQPMAVQNVQQDARFNQSFAQSTGYVPRSILAMPLFSGDQVIGVMEVLDKISAPSFGMQDMELLGLFARQAAMAIYQSQQYDRLGKTLVNGLRRLVEKEDGSLLSALSDAAGSDTATSNAEEQANIQAIADRFYALSTLGEAEQRACLEILGAFENYARSKSGSYPGTI